MLRPALALALTLTLSVLLGLPAHADSPEVRLQALGLTLPKPSKPVANYVKAVRTGNLLYLAGHGECSNPARGKLGRDMSVDEGYTSARNVALCLMATMKAELGDLSKVTRFVRMEGLVNATEDFTQHPAVVNGASDLFVEVFGARGKHARAAVGMASLPSGIAVEITLVVEVAD